MSINYEELAAKLRRAAGNVSDTVGRAANSAVRKGEELAELGRVNLRIYNLKTACDDAYREAGKLLYAGRESGMVDEEKLETTFSGIDENLAEIRTLEARAAELKNTKSCGHCGAKFAKDFAYCPVCGKKYGSAE